jgi:hypothetical protein
MMTDTYDLQNERVLMRRAERIIAIATDDVSPGQATSNILESYRNLLNEKERAAFVAVLAARIAVHSVNLSAST